MAELLRARTPPYNRWKGVSSGGGHEDLALSRHVMAGRAGSAAPCKHRPERLRGAGRGWSATNVQDFKKQRGRSSNRPSFWKMTCFLGGPSEWLFNQTSSPRPAEPRVAPGNDYRQTLVKAWRHDWREQPTIVVGGHTNSDGTRFVGRPGAVVTKDIAELRRPLPFRRQPGERVNRPWMCELRPSKLGDRREEAPVHVQAVARCSRALPGRERRLPSLARTHDERR